MLFILARLSRVTTQRLAGWRLPLAVIVFVFFTSWPAMWLAEPAANQITAPQNYWWWFVVTASTVGYGDFFPESTLGHLVGVYVIIGSIVTLTTLFTRLSTYLENQRGVRMKGTAQLDISDHVIVAGFHQARTRRMLSELLGDGGRPVVLVAPEEVEANPVPELEQVQFVRGDLSDADVLRRACVDRASIVVIDVGDDDQALTIAVTVDHANPTVHLVVGLRDMARREHLRYVNPKVQCAQWHTPKLLTEEAQDPGIAEVYADLMTSGGEGNTYSMTLPDASVGATVGELRTFLGRRHDATLLAIRRDQHVEVNPSWGATLETGTVFYYVGSSRLDPSAVGDVRTDERVGG